MRKRKSQDLEALSRRAAGGDLTSARMLVAALESRGAEGKAFVVQGGAVWLVSVDGPRGHDYGVHATRAKAFEDALACVTQAIRDEGIDIAEWPALQEAVGEGDGEAAVEAWHEAAQRIFVNVIQEQLLD